MWLEGLSQCINFNYFIWSRTRDLPTCSTLSHTLRYCVHLHFSFTASFFNIDYLNDVLWDITTSEV
jgi:hypothetical protein